LAIYITVSPIIEIEKTRNLGFISLIKQLMPALAVNIIIVHPRDVTFPRALYYIII
jgi:hypothetical protein